jgi:hypothetical protein
MGLQLAKIVAKLIEGIGGGGQADGGERDLVDVTAPPAVPRRMIRSLRRP